MAAGVQRIYGVPGHNQRVNDVIRLSRKILTVDKRTAVVYFGGDVQDYPENMQKHRDHGKFVQWSLDSTAELLSAKYPDSDILVIKASRMELKTFSCYDNFVESNTVGAPSHQPHHGALLQLAALLHSLCLDSSQLYIVGFSKGCVVLNQFLFELHYYSTLSQPEAPAVLRKIKRMTWLDGGHAGGRETWITSRAILTSFAKTGIKVAIHVTPYQVGDERRPWIGREEKQFYSTLKRLNVDVCRKLHFANIVPCLENHFQVLREFA